MSVLVEMQIDTLDEEVVRSIERTLHEADEPIDVKRWPHARAVDPLTILAVVGGIVGLVDALQSLQERWITRRNSERILLRNEVGDELELTASNRHELETFLARSGPPTVNAIRRDLPRA